MGISTMHCILLIVIPIILVFILLITYLLLILLHSNSTPTISSIPSSSNLAKSNIAENHQLSPNDLTCSPDVRICMNGGKKERKKGVQVFTYRELEEATDGFSLGNVIGNDGGFGVVFKGKLSDGSMAAIKVLNSKGKQRERKFRMEVDLLSRLHSSYLVVFLGYCADQHHRILAFEFMPNRSLRYHLQPLPSAHEPHRYCPLDWHARLRIALDCARGLEFLHQITFPPVIHRDFNSSNILLDHNFRAKISGFGMAMLRLGDRSNGISGYAAPEYASTGKLSTKSNVYSYGVVLLELLTGRVHVDTSRPHGEHDLVAWALPRLTHRDKVVKMVDPAMHGQYKKSDLIQVAAIAAVCVQPEADYRPLITDVVQSLIPLQSVGPATKEHALMHATFGAC